MGLLNRLFGSTESIAKEIEFDDEDILEQWKNYLQTVPKKKVIIGKLSVNFELKANLQELKLVLITELTSISDEEKEESELISDLEAIEHSQKIKRVHKLEQCLGYAETKHEYVHGLLHQLHSILNSQIHIVEKLLASTKHAERLISHLRSQLELELEILNKIEKIETFHNLFLSLVKGEHIIRVMDAGEKRLLEKMKKGMSKIFSGEINEGITYEWAMTVFEAIEDKFRELEAQEVLVSHPDVDFQLVNRPEFVDLVKEVIKDQRKKTSEQMVNVFVHLFREWYNHERD